VQGPEFKPQYCKKKKNIYIYIYRERERERETERQREKRERERDVMIFAIELVLVSKARHDLYSISISTQWNTTQLLKRTWCLAEGYSSVV
jgi:hypothetical protein